MNKLLLIGFGGMVTLLWGDIEYDVTVFPNKAERQVMYMIPGALGYKLELREPWGYEIKDSDIATPASITYWWKNALKDFRLSAGYSSQEYVVIGGHLEKVPNGLHKDVDPWFRVTVPAVDIDWEGYERKEDEPMEDDRIVACPMRTGMQRGKRIYLSIPQDDKSLLSNTNVKLTWDDPTLRILDEDNTPLANGGEFSLGNEGKTVYADPSMDTGIFEIVLHGPDGPTGRSRDRIFGAAKPGIMTRTAAAEPFNTSRKIVGIGEEVMLQAYGMQGNVDWSISGNGSLEHITRGDRVKLTVPCAASPTDITVTALNNGVSYSVVFHVIKPERVVFRYAESGITPVCVPPSCEFYAFSYRASVYLAPDSVNFYNLKLAEGGSLPVGTSGTFLQLRQDQLVHSPNGDHKMSNHVFPGLGSLLQEKDNLTGKTARQPFTSGSFYWTNAWTYADEQGNQQLIGIIRQETRFDAYTPTRGRLTITKESSGAYIENKDREIHVIQ